MVGVWCKDKTFKVKNTKVYLFSYTFSYFWWGGGSWHTLTLHIFFTTFLTSYSSLPLTHLC